MTAALLLICPARPSRAAEFDIGDDLRLRWDTSVRASLGLRLLPRDAALLDDPNADDGDRAFAPGVMSERIDMLTQFDISRGDLGFDASADGWYDAVYHQPTANRSPATYNPVTVPNTKFPADVARLEGGDGELLTAYAHDKLDIGGVPVTLRLGRQTLLWGESLFSTENGIAAGQAPVDDIKAAAQPLATAREVFRPVTQATASLQLSPGVSLEAYTQLEWRRDRLPGVSSYFSTTDILDAGGQRIIVGSSSLLRGPDRTPPDTGQFGLALRSSTGALDLGLYALRFDAKSPELALLPQPSRGEYELCCYRLVFPRGIGLYGLSFSTYLGDANLAGEVSARDNMPLVSRFPTVAGGSAPYAAGKTLHGQVSLVPSLPPTRFWQGATLQAEWIANGLLSVDHDAAARASGRDRFATSLRASFEPQYYEVLPRLDLTLPVGVGFNLCGNSSVLPDEVAHSGDVDAGVKANWRVVWQVALTYTHFLGAAAHQPLADRDFVLLSVGRTF